MDAPILSAQIEFPGYWCCLNERESYILSFCLVPIVLGTGYVEKTTFDAAWLLFGISPGTPMQNAFVDMYALTLTEVPSGDSFILAYVGDLSWWGIFYAFSLTDDFICVDRCFQLRYSDLP